VGRDDGKAAGEHSAIFYKTSKYTMEASGNFWLSTTPEKVGPGWDAKLNRICSWVALKDKKTGKENNITIKANSGLSEDEIQKMVADAEANAEADKKQRELVESRNTAEHQLWGVEKNLKDHGDKLVEEQKEAINEELKKIREAIAGDSVEAIQEALQAAVPKFMPLMEASQKAEAEKQAQTTAAPPPEGDATSKDENVVDADFTEKKD
jgi:molecular chaperone DnaK